MHLKAVDDQSARLQQLEALEAQTHWSPSEGEWLRRQLRALRKGMSGERNAAYYIDHAYKDHDDFAVIHDLRLVCGADVAQIDHVIVTRSLCFFLLETKCFSGDLHINELGEFAVRYGAGFRGIASPLKQSQRHEKVLLKCLTQLGITGRFGLKPRIFHAVLVDPQMRIARPDPQRFDSSDVIKADHVEEWCHRVAQEQVSLGATFKRLANRHSPAALKAWGQQLVAAHQPADKRWPDFMAQHLAEAHGAAPAAVAAPAAPATIATATAAAHPSAPTPVCAACQQPVTAEVADYCRRFAGRFGGHLYCREHQPLAAREPAPTPTKPPAPELVPATVCATCHAPLSEAVALFCHKHAHKFNGQLYCMEHQRLAAPAPSTRDTAAVQQQPTEPRAVNAVSAGEDGTPQCAACGDTISPAEAKFCWSQKRRFGGAQYCRPHQANYR